MKKIVLFFIPLMLFISLVIVFMVQLHKNADGEQPTLLESVLVGKPVPNFKLTDLFEPNKNYDQSLFSGKEGAINYNKPVFINVWATWCPTCYSEHKFLYQLSQQGINIVGVNYKDEQNKALKWLKDLNNPYQITLFDQKGMFGLDLGVYGAPETFLIDQNGIIRYRNVGDVNPDNWEKILKPLYQKLLSEKAQKND